MSYNPGYQSASRELKESTRQRFVAISFDFPDELVEAEIVAAESGVDEAVARDLVRIGRATRTLRSHGLREGASTRLLVYAASLVGSGLDTKTACEATLVGSLTDDSEMTRSLRELLRSVLG